MAVRHRGSIDWVEPGGASSARKPNGQYANWRRSCWNFTPSVRSQKDSPIPLTRAGSGSWSRLSFTKTPPISAKPPKNPNATWNARSPPTAWSLVMSGMAKRRWPSAVRSRRWRLENKWRCWSPPRFSPSNTGVPLEIVWLSIQYGSRFYRDSAQRPNKRKCSRVYLEARSTSSLALTGFSPRMSSSRNSAC